MAVSISTRANIAAPGMQDKIMFSASASASEKRGIALAKRAPWPLILMPYIDEFQSWR